MSTTLFQDFLKSIEPMLVNGYGRLAAAREKAAGLDEYLSIGQGGLRVRLTALEEWQKAAQIEARLLDKSVGGLEQKFEELDEFNARQNMASLPSRVERLESLLFTMQTAVIRLQSGVFGEDEAEAIKELVARLLDSAPTDARSCLDIPKPPPGYGNTAGPKFLIWSNEHGAWWRGGCCGYTTDLSEAGRYSEGEAVKICRDAHDGWRPGRPPPEMPVFERHARECQDHILTVMGKK